LQGFAPCSHTIFTGQREREKRNREIEKEGDKRKREIEKEGDRERGS
jgi:hypothetical protein